LLLSDKSDRQTLTTRFRHVKGLAVHSREFHIRTVLTASDF